jgi:CCR4-NOT transcriptional regulation complex NOT5 subunit
MAAVLTLYAIRHTRNWRWHKKHQVWLTKDEHMTPQMLGPTHERGYYIVWDPSQWRKDRVSRERLAKSHLCAYANSPSTEGVHTVL